MPFIWLVNNYIEVLGALTGLVYLYFSIKRIIWLWPLGIITSGFYILIFFESKFYADMSLQFYYIVVSIYGWHKWLKSKTGEGRVLIVRAGRGNLLIYLVFTLILTVIIAFFLIKFTDSPLPVWDAFTTAGSILATWMLAKRMLEHWLFWIVIDLVSMGLYIYKGLYATVVLFFVYTLMAVIGYIKWRESLEIHSEELEKL